LSGGRVWRFKAGAEGFEAMPFDTVYGIPRAIFQLAGRPVSVLSSRGLYAWRDADGRFERLPLSPPPPLAYTNLWRFDVCETTLFYPGKGCVYAYDLNADRARALPVPGEIPFMHALTPDLLALSDYTARTFWYHFAKKEITPVDPRRYGLTTKPSIFGITGVAPLGDDRFLMTSRIGACIYDLKTDRFEKQQIYASGKPIELEDMLTRVFIDENGTAWAHNVDGIVAFNSLQNAIGLLRNYHYDGPDAWSNRVIGFAEDHDGNLWFGGAGGFKKLNLHSGKIRVYPSVEGATDRLSHSSVRGMAFDGRYIVLGPTDKGVWLFDPKTERFRRPDYTSHKVRAASESDFIDFLAVMRNGDIIVCGRFTVWIFYTSRATTRT
jgi:hypothetical protein